MKKILAFFACLLAIGTASAQNPSVEMRTNHGTIVIELFADKAPKTVQNFLEYVQSGHFAGTIFHRVIEGFMIQGGGFDASMSQKPTRASIPNEAKNGLRNEPGTLAMARTSDPHSASAQFFINLVKNGFLDHPGRDGWGYAVFGKVTSGMDIVQTIAKVPTRSVAGHQNVPVQPVTIESVSVVSATPAKPKQ